MFLFLIFDQNAQKQLWLFKIWSDYKCETNFVQKSLFQAAKSTVVRVQFSILQTKKLFFVFVWLVLIHLKTYNYRINRRVWTGLAHLFTASMHLFMATTHLFVSSTHLFIPSTDLFVSSRSVVIPSSHLFVSSTHLFIPSRYLYVYSRYLEETSTHLNTVKRLSVTTKTSAVIIFRVWIGVIPWIITVWLLDICSQTKLGFQFWITKNVRTKCPFQPEKYLIYFYNMWFQNWML